MNRVPLGEKLMVNSAHSVESTSSERRASARYPLNAELEYRILTPGQESWVRLGRTLNMSRSGLLFQTEEFLENGSPVELWIDWPARPPELERWLRIWGWVVRQRERSVAIAIRQYSFEQHRKPA
jgi:hypothetical protein